MFLFCMAVKFSHLQIGKEASDQLIESTSFVVLCVNASGCFEKANIGVGTTFNDMSPGYHFAKLI